MNILIVAAHPDDEVLGMGATIKKLSRQKHKITLCVVTDGASAQYRDKKMISVRKNACIKAGNILGISERIFLKFRDMRLDTTPHLEINQELEKIIKKTKPEVVYTTPFNDLNKDHQRVFESTLVATRPVSSKVKQIMCYELTGPVKTPFTPNVYENVEQEIQYKIKALEIYKSELQKFPLPRSKEAIMSLSKIRGVEAGIRHAEAFHLIRKIE